MRRLSVLNRAILGVLLLSCCGWCVAQTPAAYEALWYLGGAPEPARRVSLQIQADREAPANKTYTWTCAIETKLAYRNALVTMTVRDAAGKDVLQGHQEMPLAQGATRCTFDLDPAALAPGAYTAEFVVQYTEKESAAKYTARIRRVSSADLAQQLDTAMAALTKMDAPDDTKKPSYTSLRIRIARDFGAKAPEDASAGKWHEYAEKVDYAAKVARGAGADIALSGLMPEAAQAPEDPALAAIHSDKGTYSAEGKPVYLFGAALSDPADVLHAKRYGLNYGVVTIHPADALTPDKDNNLSAAYGPLFSAIASANLATSVDLDAGGLAGWPLDRWPDANKDGFVNLAREDVQALIARHLKAVLPFIKSQPGIVGVGLLDSPQFKFEGDDVHRKFIEEIQTQYPDRQKLNALWSAHLATYDDITVWGHFLDGREDKKIPEYHYENKRAYTFDWTAYHLGLMSDYLKKLAGLAHSLAPDLPLSVTLPDAAFDKDEMKYAPDREEIARTLDYTSCTMTAGALDPIYALAYPHTSATLTLLQSLDPSKPVNIEDLHIPFDDGMEPAALFDYVQTLVWNSVIDGADAIALPAGAEVFGHPMALEGFASAGMDVNRLAPFVHALQRAPTDVSILYSDSSKILDGGDPHLKSCSFAYEGSSFSGLTVRYITERQCVEDKLSPSSILILPETPALRGETFTKLEAFVDGGGVAARVGSPIPYDEHGRSRTSVLRNTGKTLIVRGFNVPTEYLHAMDGVNEFGKMPQRPRPINAYGYPIEGVKTRFVDIDGAPYLYIVNIRKAPVNVFLSGDIQTGRDLIRGHDIAFPTYLDPLHPMLIHLDANIHRATVTALEPEKKHHHHKD